jgi:uncharacterized membrane protein
MLRLLLKLDLLLLTSVSALLAPAALRPGRAACARARPAALPRAEPPRAAALSSRPQLPHASPRTQRGLGPLRAGAARVALSALSLALLPGISLASGVAASEHLHLGQKVALWFQGLGLPDWAVLACISALPVVELRGGVPVGAWMGLSPAPVLVICVLANMAPIAPLLLALRLDAVKKLMAPLLTRAEKKLAGLPAGQSRWLALALFVGLPAPGTGAYTGAIIAYLLGMSLGESLSAVLAGVLCAASIMTVLTLAGRAGALVALGVLVVGGIGAILSAKDGGGTEEAAESA